MMYLGDYPTQATVYFCWNSNDQTGASILPSTAGTIYVYKDGATGTEVTTGVTDNRSFDTLAGINEVQIALTDAFYATGHEYYVVLKGAVIDTKTVNAILAHFSIERAGGILALLKSGTYGLSILGTKATQISGELLSLDPKVSAISGEISGIQQYGDAKWSTAILTSLATSGELSGIDVKVSAIKADYARRTGDYSILDAAGIRTAVGLGAANLDTQLTNISGEVVLIDSRVVSLSGEAAVIDGKVTAIPTTTPLTATTVRSALGLAAANLDTQLTNISGEVVLIKVDTGSVSGELSGLQQYGDVKWSTADVSSISGEISGVQQYGDNKWATANITTLATSGELSGVQQYGDSKWGAGSLTAVAVREEMDANSTKFVSLSGELAVIDSRVTGVAADYARRTGDYATQASVNYVSGEIDSVLVDTNELQTNQGNWLTATGFATGANLTTVDNKVTALSGELAVVDGKITAVPATISGELSGLQQYGDAKWSAIPDISALATSGELSGIDVKLSAIEADYARRTGDYSTLTQADVRTAIGLASANLDTQLTNISGEVVLIKVDTGSISGELSGVQQYGDSKWTTPDTSLLATSAQALNISGELINVKAVTTKLSDTLENDGGIYRFTENALEQAPSGVSALTAADVREEMDLNSTKLIAILSGESTVVVTPQVIAQIRSGLATSGELTAAQNDIKDHGDDYWSTVTNFATPAQVTAAVTEIENHGNANWMTATGFMPNGAQVDLVTNLNSGAVAAIKSGLALEANVEGHVSNALAAADPPTSGEAVVMKREILSNISGECASILSALASDTTQILNGISALTVGIGSIEFVYTVTSTAFGNPPIPDALVWVSTDLAGQNLIAQGRTDEYGNVTFNLNPGTHYFWVTKSGYSFSNPDTEVVS